MSLKALESKIVHCESCPRLRIHCQQIAKVKKREFKDDSYWGKPVPGFGDPKAQVLVIGLAPAAHGANRTGRMFTGDNSGLWLYRALYRAGFSNQERSLSWDDGLKLQKVYITAIARCAPPENKPTLEEMQSCSQYLKEEISELKEVRVFLVLGQIALKGLWRVLPEEVRPGRAIPRFIHGLQVPLKDGRLILCSYHPSQQNTFTKILTEPMFDQIFTTLKKRLDGK